MNRIFLRLLALGFLIASLTAADWPQWRGPNRDGISQEMGLLKEWPAEGPKLVWQVSDLGSGYSTPSIVGERLFVLASEGMENERAKAYSTKDGKQLWSTRLGNVGPNKGPNYPGSRSTPTVHGDHLFGLGSDGDLACLETASGKVVWQKNLRQDFGGETGNWAYAESPLVDGDALVCTPGGSTATLVALNKKTGETLWKCAVPEADKAAYASIIIVEAAGVKQYVQMLEKGLVGVDAKTGKLLWRYDRTGKSPANIPTPVSRQDFVYSASGRGGGGLVQLKQAGAGVEAAEIYFESKLPTAIGGAIEHKGFLYGTNTGGLMCVEYATGSQKWQERSVGPGSLCFADGRLYVHGENKPGEVALVEATPDAYRENGRFTPPGGPTERIGMAWAYPVVANGKLYIRDWNCLWCFDVAAK